MTSFVETATGIGQIRNRSTPGTQLVVPLPGSDELAEALLEPRGHDRHGDESTREVRDRITALMRFPYAAGVIALAWVIVAWVYPDTNFFLFPFFGALAIPLAHRVSGEGPASQSSALAMGTAGFATAAIAAVALSFSGKLAGEPLGWLGGTFLEALVLAFAGGILGAAIARTP